MDSDDTIGRLAPGGELPRQVDVLRTPRQQMRGDTQVEVTHNIARIVAPWPVSLRAVPWTARARATYER